VLAILAVFTGEAASQVAFANTPDVSGDPAFKACGESQFSASPILQESFVPATFAPLRPCLPISGGMLPDSTSVAVVRPHTRSEVERQADLVAALILKKYLHFRESLSSP